MSFEEVEKHPAMSPEECLRLQTALVLQERIEFHNKILKYGELNEIIQADVVAVQKVRQNILDKILEADPKASYVIHVVYGQ